MDWAVHTIVLPLLIGMIFEIMNRLVFRGQKMPRAGWAGWKGFYYVTFRAYALVLGAGIGAGCAMVGIPHPDAFGDTIAGGALAGLLSGALAMIAYTVLVKSIRAAFENIALRFAARAERRQRDSNDRVELDERREQDREE